MANEKEGISLEKLIEIVTTAVTLIWTIVKLFTKKSN